MKPLCELAEEADSHIASWMKRQPRLREESITDSLLYFFDRNSPLVWYYPFNHYEEARFSGADWDWWFLMRKGCFKIRVQAKRIKKNYDHHRDLARSNKAGYQLDILLNSSAKRNFYPIYSLYGFSENVERCLIPSYRDPSNQSCLFICSAQEVYDLVFDLPRNRIGSSDLLKISIPLTCLFCCPLEDFPNDGPRRLFQRHLFGPTPTRDEDSGEESEDQRGYEDEVPPIISDLFDAGERTSGTTREDASDDIHEILSQYQREFVETNGVAIVQIE